jgi:2-polyprenyl-3-methyl-5-hydroxy-6-metoxy-1,4-benzoquinol methylase
MFDVKKALSLNFTIRNFLNPVLTKLNKTKATSQSVPNLSGDREMEWTYIAARIGRYADENSCVLDFGCGTGTLSIAAASICSHVLSIDLMPQQFETGYSNIEFRQVDVMKLNEQRYRFDLIINCSTIEHVRLRGRYNVSTESLDGDLDAMKKLLKLIKPNGFMLMTLPVGHDAVIKPLHRIYGAEKLPRLLDGYRVIESSFWLKGERNIWIPCSRQKALTEVGNDHYYALGMMVLKAA